jgi:hypothetical protein
MFHEEGKLAWQVGLGNHASALQSRSASLAVQLGRGSVILVGYKLCRRRIAGSFTSHIAL